jgi:hypothetical protein
MLLVQIKITLEVKRFNHKSKRGMKVIQVCKVLKAAKLATCLVNI